MMMIIIIIIIIIIKAFAEIADKILITGSKYAHFMYMEKVLSPRKVVSGCVTGLLAQHFQL